MLASGHRRQMKSVWCFIWMLIALVVMATVDRVPDPPAAKPVLVQFRISSPHELPAALGTPSRFLLRTFWESERLAALAPSEPVPGINRIDPLERAADPSPPRLHS